MSVERGEGPSAPPLGFGLRVPTSADVAAWFELFADAEVMRYIGDGRVQALEWYRAFVERQQVLAVETGLCLWSVVLDAAPDAVPSAVVRASAEPDTRVPPPAAPAARPAEPGAAAAVPPSAGPGPAEPDASAPPTSGTVAGFAGLQPWTQPWGPTGRLEIGWRLGTAHQGRGLATAAARLCLARAAARGIHDPIAMIDAGNAASIAVARKLGMAPQSEHTSPTGARVLAFGVEVGTA